MAGLVATVPAALVKTALYSSPVKAAEATKVSVADVAPRMFEKLTPPLVLTSHCIVGVGVPLAAAVNFTVSPGR